MLLSHCPEILNNLIFGFVFRKSSFMAQWTCIRALDPWFMLGPASPTPFILPTSWPPLDEFQLPALACNHCSSLAGVAGGDLSSLLSSGPIRGQKQVQEGLGSGQRGGCSVLCCRCHGAFTGWLGGGLPSPADPGTGHGPAQMLQFLGLPVHCGLWR